MLEGKINTKNMTRAIEVKYLYDGMNKPMAARISIKPVP